MLARPRNFTSVRERLALNAVRLAEPCRFPQMLQGDQHLQPLGVFIGILPALGATAAALISYNETKRWSKYKEEFGKGAIEGVAGPEAANNAAVGGNMVPTLALGIPGSATTAIILAGLIVQGVRPGPHLFNEQPALLYAVFSSMLAANLIFLVLGLFLRQGLRPHHPDPRHVSLARRSSFLPSIGAYGQNGSMVDVWVMLFFGVVGFFFRRFGFSPAPLVMGLVLGKMIGGDAEAVASHLRRELADVLLAADRRGSVRDHAPQRPHAPRHPRLAHVRQAQARGRQPHRRIGAPLWTRTPPAGPLTRR